jgi:hypothetical protein
MIIMEAPMTSIMGQALRRKMNVVVRSFLVLFTSLLMAGCAEGKAMDQKMNKFEILIDRILANPPSTPDSVQSLTGVKLAPSNANDSFQIYQGSGVISESGSNVRIELRTPVSKNATSGSLLIIRVFDECPDIQAIKKRYGTLEITQIPSGKSMSEETVFSKKLDWGIISFGFPEDNKDCLRTVTLDFNRR